MIRTCQKDALMNVSLWVTFHFIHPSDTDVVFVFCVQLSYNVFFIIWLLTACHAIANVSLWPSISVLGKPSSYFQSIFTEEGLKVQAPKDGSPLAILMDLSIDYMEIANVSFYIDHAEYLVIELITPAKTPQRVIIPILTFFFSITYNSIFLGFINSSIKLLWELILFIFKWKRFFETGKKSFIRKNY